MRTSLTLTGCAVLCTALVGFAGPASASPGVGAHLTPSTVAQGGTVTVVGNCPNDIGGTYAESTAFDRVNLTRATGTDSWRGTARVRAAAKLGNHDVKVSCGSTTFTLTLTVVVPQTTRTPVGGAETGAGGATTDQSRPTGAVGVGLATALLGGVGASLVLRRRRRTHG